MNCNWRANGLRKNVGRQHRDTFTYLKQQRMTCPSILSALQNEIHMIRHPCTLWYVYLHIFVCLIHWAACSIKTKKKKEKRIQNIIFPHAFDKGVTLSTLSTFAATSHQFEISSELTKVAEPGLIGREMANFQQLPGAAEFSSNLRCATLCLWAKTMMACKNSQESYEYPVSFWKQSKSEVLAMCGH